MEVDWSTWAPRERATLLFVVQDGRILLIRKKRGLGAGKINGPGGRMEPGESPLDCAIRETREELNTIPTGTSFAGELMFQFTDGHSIHGYVYRADGCHPEPTETEEAMPLWTPIDRIPYDQMWEDDRLWLPLLLQDRRFVGRFLFDGDRMLWSDVAAD